MSGCLALQEWIHPAVLLRRLSMIGRASAQPHDDGTHAQPDMQSSAADSAPASIKEEPDLELGLLPHQNTDSASVLHSTSSDKEPPRPDRCE